MRINNNIMALNTHRQLSINNTNTQKALEKLSSGYRINRAGDDAAGLAISEKMRAQIRGLNMASKNAQDGISLIQTAEGALNEVHEILQRMRELAVQSASDTNTIDDRREIQKEVEQLKAEIDRISNTTEFNTLKLLNGSLGANGVSLNPNVVEVVSATGLNVGDYSVVIDQSATKASILGANDITGNDNDVSGWNLTINGKTIDFSGMDSVSLDEIIDKINEYSDETGVVASKDGNKLKLEQMNYGSSYEINLAGTSTSEFEQGYAQGEDAIVTITDPDGLSQQVTGVGQSISYRGAEFVAKGTTNDTANITVNSSGAALQIGANENQRMLVDINEISTTTLGNSNVGFVKDINLSTQKGANDAIKTLDEAIKKVSTERSKLGAFQNRLEHTIKNLDTSAENLQAAESRIRDVDMAKEMMEFTKQNILQQAATAMLAQANMAPQTVLKLLG